MEGRLVLSLATFALLLSQVGVPVGATHYYHEATELHRSMARYREFYEHDDIVALLRNPLQIDEKIKDKSDSTAELYSIHTGKDEIENPQQASSKEQTQVEKRSLSDDMVNATDPRKSVKEDQLGRDVLEEEKPAEEAIEEGQEIEDFEEKPQAKVHDSDPTIASTVEMLDRHLETPKKKIQPNLDEIERQGQARKNSAEIQADENSEKQQEVMKANQTEKVVQVEKETIIERLAKKNSAENIYVRQQREGSLEKDVKLETKGTRPQRQEAWKEAEEKKKASVPPETYRLGPQIDDWDEQRGDWLEQNPHMKSPEGKPKVLIVTGSQPEPCSSRVGDFFHIQSLKLKMDYARMHDYEIYYSFTWLDPLFGSYWVKLPLIRKLMLTHPEIEWFFWIDSDAIFTDMIFEPPFDTYEGYNMVLWGWNDGVYEQKLWTAFNAGVFLIRNCQWSLNLIDRWSAMGPAGPIRTAYGKMLNSFLPGRGKLFGGRYDADDQSALVYLFLTDQAVKAKVKLIEFTEYMLSGWWVDTVPFYKRAVKKYHPGFGDVRWPYITHFTGCSPCRGSQGTEDYQTCMESFNIAYNFADNQVLAFMGFEHISTSAPNVTRVRNESGRALEFVGFNPWEERIAQVAASGINPWTDTTED